MSLFLPLIPQPSDNLDFSQGQLLSNNQGLDTVFGIDHTLFSDATANKGFHNKVTTPKASSAPTTTTNPIFYAYQDSANVGVIQYSRGPGNVVPSPVTYLQSSATGITLAANTTLTIFSFTGLARSLAVLYMVDYETINLVASPGCGSFVVWDGTTVYSTDFAARGGSLQTFSSGSNLVIRNTSATNMTKIFWSLQFLRLQ